MFGHLGLLTLADLAQRVAKLLLGHLGVALDARVVGLLTGG
ncbi:hypothetical protein [Micromonospora purpureochromogenes]